MSAYHDHVDWCIIQEQWNITSEEKKNNGTILGISVVAIFQGKNNKSRAADTIRYQETQGHKLF